MEIMALVVLIGSISDYQKNYNLIKKEIRKKNIEIAYAIFDEDLRFNFLDGFEILESIEELKNKKFDYFILFNQYPDIYTYIKKMGFKQKIIPLKVFELPNFDFNKYEQLLENTPSIISRHCWGGLLYNRLGLQFNSPFINLFILDKDFNKLSKDFSYYIKQELVFDREEYEHNLNRNYPIAKLDDIDIYFNHYENIEDAKKKWDARKKRINYKNLFFETTTESRKIAREFVSLPLEHKLCFFRGKTKSRHAIDFSNFMRPHEKSSLGMVANKTANGEIPYFIDPVGLLLNYNYRSRIKFNK